MISIKDLSIGYNHPLLRPITTRIARNECIALMGVNGCGKSTLLKTMAGLLPPLGGEIIVENKNLRDLSVRELAYVIAVVLTHHSSLPNFTAKDVIKMGRIPYLNLFGKMRVVDWKAVDKAIDQLSIGEIAETPFSNLSDGQKQKVMLARGLAQETPLLILDEPTTFLDVGFRIELMQLLKEIAQDRKMAILYSSHDWDLVLAINSLMWLMTSNGEVLQGAPEELLLSGAVENSFGADCFKLDLERGQFLIKEKCDVAVSLEDSDDIRRTWTARALIKKGFYLEQNSPIRISKAESGWVIYKDQQQFMAKSIEEILLFLTQ